MQLGPTRRACLFLLALACACSRAPDASTPGDAPAPNSTASPATRIVPASATAVDFVAALVGPERIAGFPRQALEYSSLHDDPRFAEHPTFYAFLAEPVLELGPDLVVSDPWQARDTQERLREAGVPVVVLPEVATYAEARAVLESYGRTLGVEPRAAALIADLDARVAALRKRAAARGRHLRAMTYSNFGSAGFTAGSRSTVHEIMELAGLENLVASAGLVGHVSATFEDLLLYDPDLILVSLPLKQDAAHAGDRGGASREVLLGEPSLATLRAVQADRILSLPAWLYATSSHELVSSAEFLADEVDALVERLDAEGLAR